MTILEGTHEALSRIKGTEKYQTGVKFINKEPSIPGAGHKADFSKVGKAGYGGEVGIRHAVAGMPARMAKRHIGG